MGYGLATLRPLANSSTVISAVLFDLDETLLDRTTSLVSFLRDQHRRFLGSLGNTLFDLFCTRFLQLDSRGRVQKSVVYGALLNELGGAQDAASMFLADYYDHCWRFAQGFAGMTETLAGLRSRGLRLGIVTNGETMFQTPHINALGLPSLADAVLVSETQGLRKPDQRLFLRAADRLRIAPEDCLFVGDNATADVIDAQAAGMQTVWFAQGQTWPIGLPPMPGIAINALPDLLAHLNHCAT
jgi:putative hydrolase of the HAD superfamily